jgi:hypothetical protein
MQRVAFIHDLREELRSDLIRLAARANKPHEGVANGVRCWHFSDCVDGPAMRLLGGKRTWRGHRVSTAISDKTAFEAK